LKAKKEIDPTRRTTFPTSLTKNGSRCSIKCQAILKKTEAIHFPVDKEGKFDPKTEPYIAPPNTNEGKTVVPGKGPLFALGNGAIPMGSGKSNNGKRSLEALQYLNELVRRELEERDAEPEAYDYFEEWDTLSY
jgi:hypothetical protein